MRVKIYVEGGGDSKEQHVRCREGFRKLINKAGFTQRSPAIVACGSRLSAYDQFKAATVSNNDVYPILLVDSEDPVRNTDENPDSEAVWQHLRVRDNWERPSGATSEQAQLMATCMETWIMADHKALQDFFGQCLQTSALLPLHNIEERTRHEVQEKLAHATRTCGRGRSYVKGEKSFKVLAELDPATLKKYLPHFRRLIATLERRL